MFICKIEHNYNDIGAKIFNALKNTYISGLILISH